MLKEKYGPSMPILPTVMVYHGTSSTNPDEIIKGEEGFDMRYSADGYWGRAVYFAVNSSYSNVYSYKNESSIFSSLEYRDRQMFYAKVNIGLFHDAGH